MTNETLAEIAWATRERLAAKANAHLDALAKEVTHRAPYAAQLIGRVRAVVEQLRDVNSDDDGSLNLRGMATRFDLHAVELAESDDYEGAKLAIECAEAFARRQEQIDASAFREPSVDRGSIR